MSFIYALALCLFLFNIRFKSLEERLTANNLTKDNTAAIRGICVLLVIFHHLGQVFRYEGVIANISNYFGGVSVGLFFFFSAYGLCVQYKKYGSGYLKKIILFKIPKIYAYLIIANIIYYLTLEYPLMEDDLRAALFRIFCLDWTRRPNQDAWYLYTLIVMYALFVCVFFFDKFIKNKNVTVVIMALIPVVYIIVVNAIGYHINYTGLWLYGRNIQMFSLGILYAAYKAKIDNFLRCHNRTLFVGLTFMCVVGLQYYCEEVISVAVGVLVVLSCMYVSLSNKVINLLGKISLQVYLTQRMFIRLFEALQRIPVAYAVAVIACSIAGAAVIYYLDACLSSLRKKTSQKFSKLAKSN